MCHQSQTAEESEWPGQKSTVGAGVRIDRCDANHLLYLSVCVADDSRDLDLDLHLIHDLIFLRSGHLQRLTRIQTSYLGGKYRFFNKLINK